MNVAELQRANALCRTNEPAIVDGDTILTHGALDEQARRVATWLAEQGVAAGDVVGVSLFDGWRTLVAWLALARLGAAIVPMDWRWTVQEQRQIAAVMRPRLILAEPDRRMDDSLPCVRLDADWQAQVDLSPPLHRMAPGGHSPFIMNMSSGTTGLPKGNVHTHATYLCILRAHFIDMGQRPDDRVLAVLPLAPAAGRSIVLATLLMGGTVHFAPPLLSASEIAALCTRQGITVLCVVPTIVRSLLRIAPEDRLLLPGLRCFISVGAMLFPDESAQVRRRISPHLINYYGSTGGGINTMLLPHELDAKPGSVGRPALGCEIEIVDDRGAVLPHNETGRLRVRCGSTCRGAYPPDPLDDTYFEGWHYPGDYACLDEDGYLFLQGRYNDIIIRGGSNVYAPEVERALLGLPAIKEAAVFGMDSGAGDEAVVAFIVADPGLADDVVIRHCRGRLAAYKVPTHLHRIDALPRNSIGKVLKRELLATLRAAQPGN